MSFTRWLIPAIVGAGLIAAPMSASAESPFGGAKRQTLSTATMKEVTGQYTTSQIFAYYGLYYGAYAQLYGTLGFYGDDTNYYYYAQDNAYLSYYYYFYAWYYS